VTRPEMIFFDVNETLLDLAPLRASVGDALGGRPELAPLWFTTLLQYSLVATVADRYRNLDEIGAACLRMLAATRGLTLGGDAIERCLAPMRSLPPHPDVVPALERLRGAGLRLAALTNSSTATATAQIRNAGLADFFERSLSVEEVRLYKPHSRVYHWAAGRVGADVSRCLLVAAHGWDVAGAAWVGMKTAFVARPGQQPFPLGPAIDLTIPTFEGLADALLEEKPL